MLVHLAPIHRFGALSLLLGLTTLCSLPAAAMAQQSEIQQLEDFLTPKRQSAPSAAQPARFDPPSAPIAPPQPQNGENTSRDPRDAQDAAPADGMVRVESRNVAVTTTSAPRLDLGPEFGDGEFLVLMTYQDESSLIQAKQHSQGAFVTQFNGVNYIQLAVFDQLEYARHMADNLRREGISAIVPH